MPYIEAEYKGKPTLTLKAEDNDRFPFTFGLAKARLILANLDIIQAFVNKHTTEE